MAEGKWVFAKSQPKKARMKRLTREGSGIYILQQKIKLTYVFLWIFHV
jgi:hypothetical protein